MGENFVSDQDQFSDNWMQFRKNRKKFRILQFLIIAMAENFGGDLECGRKSMVVLWIKGGNIKEQRGSEREIFKLSVAWLWSESVPSA